MSSDRDFEAKDLIEVMDEAVRYNAYLIETLRGWGEGLGSVLDFGAGNGRFATALYAGGMDVHVIEPDPRLREKIAGHGPIPHESLEALDERRFDGIYTVNVLEHLKDDQAFLDAFYRTLEPGGRLLLYVPAFPILFSANDARVGHYRRYRLQPLVDMVRRAGFRVEDARYVDSIGFVAGLAYRFLGNSDGGLNVRAVKLYDGLVFPLSRVLDRLLDRVLGKNLLLRAVRPPSS